MHGFRICAQDNKLVKAYAAFRRAQHQHIQAQNMHPICFSFYTCFFLYNCAWGIKYAFFLFGFVQFFWSKIISCCTAWRNLFWPHFIPVFFFYLVMFDIQINRRNIVTRTMSINMDEAVIYL